MTSFLDPLISFVSAHAWLAYLTLFLAALLEAVPVVGSVVPGSTIILALSALVPGGELKLQWVLLAAAFGAVLGDGSAVVDVRQVRLWSEVPSLRGDAKHRTRNLAILRCAIAHHSSLRAPE